jgi:hypothetical protein
MPDCTNQSRWSESPPPKSNSFLAVVLPTALLTIVACRSPGPKS